jgi:hypothetical protein
MQQFRFKGTTVLELLAYGTLVFTLIAVVAHMIVPIDWALVAAIAVTTLFVAYWWIKFTPYIVVTITDDEISTNYGGTTRVYPLDHLTGAQVAVVMRGEVPIGIVRLLFSRAAGRRTRFDDGKDIFVAGKDVDLDLLVDSINAAIRNRSARLKSGATM